MLRRFASGFNSLKLLEITFIKCSNCSNDFEHVGTIFTGFGTLSFEPILVMVTHNASLARCIFLSKIFFLFHLRLDEFQI